ncbi:MAG: hypothetical protein KH282_04950 [Clostridiales bacterium]|nr:hypothetical protein [Clostridiales bacterium]
MRLTESFEFRSGCGKHPRGVSRPQRFSANKLPFQASTSAQGRTSLSKRIVTKNPKIVTNFFNYTENSAAWRKQQRTGMRKKDQNSPRLGVMKGRDRCSAISNHSLYTL